MIDAIDRADLLLCECSEFVTKKRNASSDASCRDISGTALPQGLTIVRGLVSAKFSVRVLAYLSEAERRTEVAYDQEAYRIAWLTVLRADEGNPEPWRSAFWEIIGNTPEKAIPFWVCRRDLFEDPYVPLHMIDLKYTKEWGSDYIRAKMVADAARAANLPIKKPVESVPFPAMRTRKKREQGISVWTPIIVGLSLCLLFILWLASQVGRSESYLYPHHYWRVVQNLSPCQSDGSCGNLYLIQEVNDGVANPPTEVHFRGAQHFENGHTFSWLKGRWIGTEFAIEGFDLVRERTFVNGEWQNLATIPSNCTRDYAIGHIVCKGGVAKFD